MLSSLLVRGYKSYEKATPLPLRRLTILLGKNNSGKTAAARLPALLLSAASSQAPARSPVPLRIGSMTYASRVQDLAFGHQPHASFYLGLSLTDDMLRREVSFQSTIQLQQSFEVGRTSFVSAFSCSAFPGVVEHLGGAGPRDMVYSHGVDGFRGLLPIPQSDRLRRAVEHLRQTVDEALLGMTHLTAVRAPVEPIYEDRPMNEGWDTTGAEVPYLLNSDADLMTKVSSWYSKNLGAPPMDAYNDGASFSLALGGMSSASGNLASAGQGMQQALPVVVRLLSAAGGYAGHELLVVEEPELHLHPAAHGAIGDLAVRAATSPNRPQVLIETHSENVVLRVRRRVAEGVLDPTDVQILWFDQTDDRSTVEEIRLDETGAVSDWPSGVFSEDLAEVREINRARRR